MQRMSREPRARSSDVTNMAGSGSSSTGGSGDGTTGGSGGIKAATLSANRIHDGWRSLEAHDVVVTFPGHERPVLRGVSLAIERGTTTAILGPSGSGKSTLLSVLGGLRKPNSGSVQVRDSASRTFAANPALLTGLSSWILQTTNVFPDRTALDNVALGAVSIGRTWEEALVIAEDLLEQVDLSHRAVSRASTLSGGEVQRIVIARAISSGRNFLLCDEPTGQLDHSTSDLILRVLFDLVTSSQVGLAIVTHDASVAARCQRIVTIDDGLIQSVSPSPSVGAQPSAGYLRADGPNASGTAHIVWGGQR